MIETTDDADCDCEFDFPPPGGEVRDSLFPDIDRARRDILEEGWPDENPFDFVRELAAA